MRAQHAPTPDRAANYLFARLLVLGCRADFQLLPTRFGPFDGSQLEFGMDRVGQASSLSDEGEI
jgi:hypothetical protein